MDSRGSPAASRSFLRLVEVDLLAGRITQVVPAKRCSAQPPAGQSRQRHGDLREPHTGDVVPVGIGPGHEGRIWGAHQNRWEDRQDAVIEEGPVVEQISSGHEPVVGDSRNIGEAHTVLMVTIRGDDASRSASSCGSDGDERPVRAQRHTTRWRFLHPSETHSSSATSSARKPGLATTGFLGCWQIPGPVGPIPALCGRLENR